MRVANWNPNKFDETFENICIDRLVDAAEVIAAKARANVPHKLNLRRPVYKKGKYEGRLWTSREPGRLKESIRVRRRRTKSGKAFSRKRNVRVYAGHYIKGDVEYANYLAYYAAIVEYTKAYLRPAFYSSESEIKSIIGVR